MTDRCLLVDFASAKWRVRLPILLLALVLLCPRQARARTEASTRPAVPEPWAPSPLSLKLRLDAPSTVWDSNELNPALLVFRYSLTLPPEPLGTTAHQRTRMLGGVGLLGLMGYSLLGSAQSPEQEDEICVTNCLPLELEDPKPDAPRNLRRWFRGMSLGLGVAALSGAVWLTLSEEDSPLGKRTRLGVRPVRGGSVGLVGARF